MKRKSNILVVEDSLDERETLFDLVQGWGFDVSAVSDGLTALERLEVTDYSLVITDLKMPRLDGIELLEKVRRCWPNIPVVLVSGFGSVDVAVNAMKLGAFDFVVKPFPSRALEVVVRRALVQSEPQEEASRNIREKSASIITRNPHMQRLLELVKSVANSKAPVLVQGESGTGKELFARFVHANSERRNCPFVALNCAALPDGLLESELFGHEKGAFTGATSKKPGKFELASGGTILLDEIGEMNLNLQAKLLRVLQESEVDRVGGLYPVSVDARVVATTNRDMELAVQENKFRADLYYRLNVIPVKLPPLRARREDITPLAEYFVQKYNKIDGRSVKGLTDEAAKTLTERLWPGNVRELENTMERAVLLCKNDLIEAADLFWADPGSYEEEISEQSEYPSPESGSLREMERRMIFDTLDKTNGNRTHTAEILGISVRTLRNKLHEYQGQMQTL